MSYEPTTWVTGDIITATKLNNIESGVQSVSSSYTPTTWATGDIITAVKLNNIEQGIANAGGGSSDFSTAQVTVVANGLGYNLAIPHIVETPSAALVGTVGVMGEGSTDVVIVPLYKGQCVISPDVAVETSGNIQDVGGGFYIITGDCTITIS